MKQKKLSYSISGYRHAPESFHIAKGVTREKRKAVPLSNAQRHEVGCLFLSQGHKAAVDCVKRIERKREHECHIYMTYGWFTQEDPRTYIYCEQIRCRITAPLGERAAVFKEFRSHMKQIGGKIEQSTQCSLDGRYRPINVEKKYLTADFSRPVVIRLIKG